MAKFKKQKIFGTSQRKQFAEDYYKTHRKTVDAAVDEYRKNNNIDAEIAKGKLKPVSNEEIFVAEITYGTHTRGWYSKKTANASVARKLYELRNGDTEWYDAYHGIANEEDFPQYKDLRKFNNKKASYTDYEFGDPTDKDGQVVGYYSFGDPNVVLARVFYKPSSDSPYETWELRNKYDIGL